jgi:hypothetical protein
MLRPLSFCITAVLTLLNLTSLCRAQVTIQVCEDTSGLNLNLTILSSNAGFYEGYGSPGIVPPQPTWSLPNPYGTYSPGQSFHINVLSNDTGATVWSGSVTLSASQCQSVTPPLDSAGDGFWENCDPPTCIGYAAYYEPLGKVKLNVGPNASCGKTSTGASSCPGPPPNATCDTSNPANVCSPNIVLADGIQSSTLYVNVTPHKSVIVSLSLCNNLLPYCSPPAGSVTGTVTTGVNGQATATYTATNYQTGANTVGDDLIQAQVGTESWDKQAQMYDYAAFQFTQSQVSNTTFTTPDDLSAAQIQTFLTNVPTTSGTKGDFLAKFYLDQNAASGGWYDPNSTGQPMETYNPNTNGIKKYCPTSTSCPMKGDTGELAASVIFNFATTYDINPKLLLVKLQKEKSLISQSTMPPALVLNKATGCGGASQANFYSQLGCAANTFFNNYELDPTPDTAYFWPVHNGQVVNSIQFASSASANCKDKVLTAGCALVGFWVTNAATFAQYKYTPFVQTTTTGGGVRLFEQIWQQYSNASWYQ